LPDAGTAYTIAQTFSAATTSLKSYTPTPSTIGSVTTKQSLITEQATSKSVAAVQGNTTIFVEQSSEQFGHRS